MAQKVLKDHEVCLDQREVKVHLEDLVKRVKEGSKGQLVLLVVKDNGVNQDFKVNRENLVTQALREWVVTLDLKVCKEALDLLA